MISLTCFIWGTGGFSLHTSVRIAGHDRARLERLLRSADVPALPDPKKRGSTRETR
jgi:hypothetical protein